MDILSEFLMDRLQKFQVSNLALACMGETTNFSDMGAYGCHNQCSGSCEGDCEGSCDTSCYGGCEGSFGYE